MWNDEVDIVVKLMDKRIICCDIKNEKGLNDWRFYGCYGTPYGVEKANFWVRLEDEIFSCEIPWVIMGDLNEVIDDREKI